MAVKKRLATLLVLMLLLLWKAEAANPVTCTAVTTRYNTTVICDFGLDISKSQHGFNVQFYDRDNTALARTVLACNFIEGGDLVCHEGSGIIFDKNKVSDQIQVIGPAAVDKVGSRYACQLAPAVGRIETCNLTYKASPTTPTANTSPTTPTPKPHKAADKDVDDIRVILIILFIIIIIIIVFAVVFCGILYFKRENVHQRCTEFAIGVWSGHGKVSEETGSKDASAFEKGKREKIPEGWAAYYYNLGWRQCQKEEHDSNEGDKTDIGSSKEHREKEQQNQDKVQPEARPKQGVSTGFPFRIIAGKGPKQDLQKEQRNKKDKGDPDQEANQRESASAGDPMLHRPPSSVTEGRQSWVPSGAAAQGHFDDEFFHASSGESSPNEGPLEERTEGKKKKGIMKRLKRKITKKKGEED